MLVENKILLDQIPGGIFISDLNDKIIYANEAALAAFNNTPMLKRPLTDFLAKNDRINQKEGSIFFQSDSIKLRANYKSFYSGNSELRGKIFSISATQKVVTDLKKKLDKAESNLNEFTYIISHDLKAPLRAINGLSTWLAEDYKDVVDDEGREQLDLLAERARTLSAQVEAILQYSRIGRIEQAPKIFELSKIFDQIVRDLNTPARIKLEIPKVLPKFNADEVQICKMFKYLIANAIDHNDKGADAWVVVRYTKNNENVCFEIIDNGVGLKPKYIPTAFKIFQKHHIKKNHLGVGLTLANRIAEHYNGKIEITSEYGKGTSLSLKLPLSLLEE